MEYNLKRISTAGIPEAIAKAGLYRSLNEPEEAESICRDILAVEPQHQLALRLLGLVARDEPAVGRHHPPPRQVGRAGGQQVADRPGRPGAAGVGGHLPVGHDLPRPQPPDDLFRPLGERARHRSASSRLLRPKTRRRAFQIGS